MDHSQSQFENQKPKASARIIIILLVASAAFFAVIFLLGYLPRQQREKQIVEAAQQRSEARPTVLVAEAQQADKQTELLLPGNIQPITEAPILARAEGYLVKRYVDIGDRVQAGQLLAELDTPDLDQQVQRAQAALQQAKADLMQSQAALEQARANAKLAKVTSERNNTLVARGVLSRQEGDQSTATYSAQSASVHAGEANVSAAQQTIRAAEAELQRLTELQSFKKVRAPYAGVVTLRNTDTGALISNGSSLLFRLAQTGTLRIFINVPQANYTDLRVGTPAEVIVSELPGRTFQGTVSRISGSLDTATRTMLTEIQIANPDSALLPGMYAQVRFSIVRSHPPVVIPGEAVVIRGGTTSVASVNAQNTVRFHPVTLGRDYGQTVEIVKGLRQGERVVVNPTDKVREGIQVNVTSFQDSSKPTERSAGSNGNAGREER